jgi:hypothetical protein
MKIIGEPKAKRLRLSLPLQTLCVLILALAAIAGGVRYGNYEERQCAIEYPHEGQCGLEAMMGMAYGLVGGLAILVLGGIGIFYQGTAKNGQMHGGENK